MLPVLAIRDQILAVVAAGNRLVLTAPTGSGKTTQVPQILASSPAVRGHILVLEPRRLAARMTARRVAFEMGSEVGALVGYQTRFESKVSSSTRIRFLTEGVFLRLLESNHELRGVGAVVLDEFHERSIDADLALGLLKRLQESGRPDLKLVVMSATLETERVAAYLGGCPTLAASGRLHPVTIEYLDRVPQQPVWDVAAAALDRVLDAEPEGHALIFMPGGFEIDRTIGACNEVLRRRGADVSLFPLHGSLPPAEQDRAVEPSDRRKVIVATNVAETSITIEGVRAVIDCGTARVHRVDPKRGLNTLRIEPIARATADQRAGRAGRVAPGRCLRLWTAKDHGQRPDFEDAEIARVDLAEATLRLRSLGVERHADFPWFEAPPSEMVDRAEACLAMLHAVDENGRLTATGAAMAGLPAEPRLARVLVEGARRRCPTLAARLAAIGAERDFLADPGASALREALERGDPISDVLARERVLSRWEAGRLRDLTHRVDVNHVAARECAQAARQLSAAALRLGERRAPADPEASGADGLACLVAGFPDHLAWRPDRQRPHCHMPGRRKVTIDRSSIVTADGFLLGLEIRETGAGDATLATLSMVSPIDAAVVEELLPERFATVVEVRWNESSKAVDEIEERRFDGIAIASTARPARPSPTVERVLLDKIRDGTIALERWDESVEQWIARVRFAATWFPERGLMRYADDELDVIRSEILSGCVRASDVRDRPCLEAVRDALSQSDQEFVRRVAPDSVQLKRGFRMRLDYAQSGPPRGRARIQDLYGDDRTPTVANGRVPVTLEILGPNQRPLQVTSDLANFWKTLYPELRNELRRRYPKHEWR